MGKLGVSIRQQRKRKGLKVCDLAGKIRVTPEFITEIERGYRYPSTKNLGKICKVLGFDFNPIYLKERHPKIMALLKNQS